MRERGVIDAIFGEGGALSRHISHYRPRPGQIELARGIYEALENRRHFIAEAPTGTGKSAAAAIPAGIYALHNGLTVVYCTANIALQEQLVFKDLTMIRDVIEELLDPEDPASAEKDGDGHVFRYGIIKGMSNYLCKAEFENASRNKLVQGDWLRRLEDWSKKTSTGDRGELELEPPSEVWARVSTSSEDCYRQTCPKFEECHVFRAREKLREVHLVVTNYHLLFIDRQIRLASSGKAGILPDYDIVIMDELHDVPSIAMDFRGFNISAGRFGRIRSALRKFAEEGDRDAEALRKRVEANTARLFEMFAHVSETGSSIIEDPIGEDHHVLNALEDAAAWMGGKAEALRELARGGQPFLYVTSAKLARTAENTLKLRADLSQLCYGEVPERRPIGFRFNLDTKRREETYESGAAPGSKKRLGSFPAYHVFSFEKDGRGQVGVACKVLDAGSFLQEALFSSKTVVGMSATLSARGSLSFMTEQLGLSDGEFESLIVESPFDSRNVLVVTPESDFPAPDEADFPDCVAQVCAGLAGSMREGGIMALFTSYRNMGAVERAVRASESARDMCLFVQGQMGKRQIIREFTRAHGEGKRAMILATSSFWQGVDIPGQALSVVVIDKIPFAPPDDPVMWYLERTTQAAFRRYGVPKAIIELKQGVGRLIRREEDYGAVVILDKRIGEKSYGRSIEAAFPDGCYFTHDFDHVVDFLEERRELAAARERSEDGA